MSIRDMTLSDIEQLGQVADTLDVTFQMDEDAFRSFYDRTARPMWAYLSRTTGDNRLADDLLQETYYRFLRARGSYTDEAQRRHYLFRIAVNLVRDHYRRPRWDSRPRASNHCCFEPGAVSHRCLVRVRDRRRSGREHDSMRS